MDMGPKSVPKQRAVLWGVRDGGEEEGNISQYKEHFG